MVTINSIHMFLAVVLACTSCTTAFFLNWGSPEPSVQIKHQPLPQWPVNAYYQQRLMQAQPQYSVSNQNPDAQPIPAIPIQVPLQAQLTPASNIQHVQLVPCLCPVAQDYEQDKFLPEGSQFYQQAKPKYQN